MDDGGDLGSAAKGSAIDLEVASSGLVSCRFSFIPFSFLPCVVLQPIYLSSSFKQYVCHTLNTKQPFRIATWIAVLAPIHKVQAHPKILHSMEYTSYIHVSQEHGTHPHKCINTYSHEQASLQGV